MQKKEFGSPDHKKRAQKWFLQLRNKLCETLESIENTVEGPNASMDLPPGKFIKKTWDRIDDVGKQGGGGLMSLLQGRVFEKAGVNISTVEGEFSQDFRKKMPGASEDPRFWATGISVVIHPFSPLVPAVHMNTRFIITTHGWFGGGSDLTPVEPNPTETMIFHEALKKVCDKYNPHYYLKYKKWCDEYFYLPHRNEPRGVGGIFYDNLNSGNWEKDFSFTQDVGRAFLSVYPHLVERVMNLSWTNELKEAQLKKRGRYVEFNLLYDRGTLFGLKTGGNIEAILMSMPPMVKWS